LHKRLTGDTGTCTLEVYIQFTGGSKQIKVSVSPIGRVSVEWIKNKFLYVFWMGHLLPLFYFYYFIYNKLESGD